MAQDTLSKRLQQQIWVGSVSLPRCLRNMSLQGGFKWKPCVSKREGKDMLVDLCIVYPISQILKISCSKTSIYSWICTSEAFDRTKISIHINVEMKWKGFCSWCGAATCPKLWNWAVLGVVQSSCLSGLLPYLFPVHHQPQFPHTTLACGVRCIMGTLGIHQTIIRTSLARLMIMHARESCKNCLNNGLKN